MGIRSIGNADIIGDVNVRNDLGVSVLGHNLLVKHGGGVAGFFPHSRYQSHLTIEDTEVLYAYAYTVRYISQSDESGEWSGTVFDSIVTSPSESMTNAVYIKTGVIAATEPVRICIFEGEDETGELVFDQVYPASDFPANTEVFLKLDGASEYTAGITYFGRYKSDATFSLKTNAAGTEKWLAVDLTSVRHDSMLQTRQWTDGSSWNDGDYFIDGRKIYVCNTTGQQDGTFASNSALWDEMGSSITSATHDADRIISPDGLSNLTITNTSLIHNDGVDRLQINEGFTALKSPDGNVGLVVSNTGALYGVTEIATVDDLHAEYTHPTGDGNSHVPANSTTNDGKVLTASAVAGTYTWEAPVTGDGTGDVIGPSSSIDYRVPTFNGTTGKLLRQSQVSIGPSGDVLGVNSMVIDQLYLTDNVITKTGTGGSLTITDTVTGITSDGGSYMAVMDGVATFFDAVRDRFYIDPTETKMVSPDGTNALTIDNNGVDINAYTKLGGAAPAIKMKKLTGTTPAVEGNSVTIAHGLTGSKILAVDVLVGYSSNANNGMPPGYLRIAGYEYYAYQTSSGIVVYLSATNSERVLSDTIRILLTYEE